MQWRVIGHVAVEGQNLRPTPAIQINTVLQSNNPSVAFSQVKGDDFRVQVVRHRFGGESRNELAFRIPVEGKDHYGGEGRAHGRRIVVGTGSVLEEQRAVRLPQSPLGPLASGGGQLS